MKETTNIMYHHTHILRYMITCLLWVVMLSSCKQGSDISQVEQETQQTQGVKESLSTEVKMAPCIKDLFIKKTLLTGVIKARESAIIKSEVGGVISRLTLLDGRKISKNELLLQIDDTEEQYALAQAKIRYDEAVIKKNDLIIQYGGTPDDDTSVKPYQLKFIYANTGYLKTVQDIKELEFRISRKKIRALFTGTIADLKIKQYELINPGQDICTLINTASFEVSFMVMENHALRLTKGQTIAVHPIQAPHMRYNATVTIINPKVTDQGLVEARARVIGKSDMLFENMNMRVVVEEKTQSYILIPKSALVRRSDRTVVFTYNEESQSAKWNYVTVVDENDTHYAISEGLQVGDLIIYEGNLNLDHDASVTVSKDP